jgi:hypothetical protein
MPCPMAIADLLAGTLQGKPVEKRLEEGKIWLVWTAAVGKQIAGKARPVSFRDGILTVVVSSPPWMQQLTFLKKGMIDTLNERLGRELVRDIYLKAGGREASPPPPRTPRLPVKPLSPAELDLIDKQTECIGDPELRTAFVKLLEKQLAGNRS